MKSLVAALVLLVSCFVTQTAFAQRGFDEFGYNYTARIFVGPLDGADRNFDGTYWGDATFAKDMLVMKWSKGWDDARFNGGEWGPDCWVDNEFNGQRTDGSGWSEHVKIVWVGAEGEFSRGGIPIWGQFEIVMDQGIYDPSNFEDGGHFWSNGPVTPNGYGANVVK